MQLSLLTRIGTTIVAWNIRTMNKAGKATMIANEMKRYKLGILGLCETRWIQSG